ncbi:hypothetical protein GGR52DRAFT_588959 [Hypoxylon sp. FL1284]|nr:hypothetical protein GGR52DRAFT_588959 [Hypoxylon sp. FL1284]
MSVPLLGSDWKGPLGTDIYPWVRAVTVLYEDNVPEAQRDPDAVWRTLIANRTTWGAVPGTKFQAAFLSMQTVMHMIHTKFENPIEKMAKPGFQDLSDEEKAETMLLLKSHRFFIVTGNHEEWMTEVSRDSQVFCLRMQEVCLSRRIAVTRGGMLALVPMHTAVGDKVFLIPGLATPFLLREHETERTEIGRASKKVQQSTLRGYQLVGETYVHGAMEGEKWDQDQLDMIRIS